MSLLQKSSSATPHDLQLIRATSHSILHATPSFLLPHMAYNFHSSLQLPSQPAIVFANHTRCSLRKQSAKAKDLNSLWRQRLAIPYGDIGLQFLEVETRSGEVRASSDATVGGNTSTDDVRTSSKNASNVDETFPSNESLNDEEWKDGSEHSVDDKSSDDDY
ncbi:hypothetical protein NE237_028524 [Protea cynaroides]|uniref:Uncharacterized protein n=1 Tax=Protea cynaroides TaxID=273540 RepID=A0A9Q0JU60_9MAGN|nr:hypothetical protein NE237_028524 [Protea cynaroides]